MVIARLLGADDYSSLAALVSTWLILALPGSALQVTAAREVTEMSEEHYAELAQTVRGWMREILVLALVATGVCALLRNQLADVIGVDLPWAAAFAVPSACLWMLLCVQRGALQGTQGYRLVGLSVIWEASMRIAFSLAAVALGLGVTGVYGGMGLSLVATAAVLLPPLHRHLGDESDWARLRAFGSNSAHRLGRLVRQAWAPIVALALIAVLQNVDVIVVKHEASNHAAGAYGAASLAAKAIVWLAVGLGLYLLPETARREQEGEDTRRLLLVTFGLLLAAALPIIAIYAVGGHLLLKLVFGAEFATESEILPLLATAMTLLAMSYLCVQFLLALRRLGFLWILAFAAILEPFLLQLFGAHLTRLTLALLCLQLALAALLTLLSLTRKRLR